MITWGINALNHDASLAVVTDDLLFWKKTSDYSKIDRDDKLNNELLENALTYGKPDKIIWFCRKHHAEHHALKRKLKSLE
jgi:hypothetical protein